MNITAGTEPAVTAEPTPKISGTPPRPPLTLRIGVAGHRPDDGKRPAPDRDAIDATVREVLNQIRDCFQGIGRAHERLFALRSNDSETRAHDLRVLSSLAEGADQWVASIAWDLGYELQCILPFSKKEYAKDFPATTGRAKSAAHQTLDDLCKKASLVVELDGDRARLSASYQAATRMVLRQSDLLIAVWDGADEFGAAGTAATVREALLRGIPTIWIHWASPRGWGLLKPTWSLLERPQEMEGDKERLRDVIAQLLLPPQGERGDARIKEEDLREAYFAEPPPPRTLLGGWWNLFRDLFSGKLWADLRKKGRFERLKSHLDNFSRIDFISRARAGFHRSWTLRADRKTPLSDPMDAQIASWVSSHFIEHYAWADHLSVYYANLYRSAFVVTFLLGAIAVFLALFTFAAGLDHAQERWPVGLELAIIATILLIIRRSWQRHWHQRWIDYRTLAERLRLSHFLILLGGGGQQVAVPQHLATYGNPAATWMHWHYRAVERAAGLPDIKSLKFDANEAEYLGACRELFLESLLEDQKAYHSINSNRLELVDRRLHKLGTGFFVATLVACAIHFGIAWLPPHSLPEWCGRWLTMANAFFPALGAALAAIRNQGEFQRVAQRSKAMHARLIRLQQDMAEVAPRPGELASVRLRTIATTTAQLMVNEVLDWRIVFQDRPPVLPS